MADPQLINALIQHALEGCTGNCSVEPFTCPGEYDEADWCSNCLANEAAKQLRRLLEAIRADKSAYQWHTAIDNTLRLNSAAALVPPTQEQEKLK